VRPLQTHHPRSARCLSLQLDWASASHFDKRLSTEQVTAALEYAPVAPYDLVLEICDDDFDSAMAARGCWYSPRISEATLANE
jgi:hypothetical protein